MGGALLNFLVAHATADTLQPARLTAALTGMHIHMLGVCMLVGFAVLAYPRVLVAGPIHSQVLVASKQHQFIIKLLRQQCSGECLTVLGQTI